MHAYLQPMEVLIQQIDPEGSGCITFAMFRAGVETYLASELCMERRESGAEGESGEKGESEEECSPPPPPTHTHCQLMGLK